MDSKLLTIEELRANFMFRCEICRKELPTEQRKHRSLMPLLPFGVCVSCVKNGSFGKSENKRIAKKQKEEKEKEEKQYRIDIEQAKERAWNRFGRRATLETYKQQNNTKSENLAYKLFKTVWKEAENEVKRMEQNIHICSNCGTPIDEHTTNKGKSWCWCKNCNIEYSVILRKKA